MLALSVRRLLAVAELYVFGILSATCLGIAEIRSPGVDGAGDTGY
jgi:hypothetical protein